MKGSSVLGIGLTGPTLTDLERRVLEEMTPYSVILFARNVEGSEQLRSLVAEIKSYGAPSPLVVIDQEGGRVDRLRELIPGIPGATETASIDDSETIAHRLGELIGETLHHFGIDVNLAPVVDVERDEPVKGLERRTWGKDPARVVALAGAFMQGQQRFGVGSCLKHFPGLGAGYGDPHYGASVVNVSDRELETIDLAPYRQLASNAGAVMIGHTIYPAVEDEELPATLSRRISTGLLREVIGFDGVAFSDDMEMHAVSDLGSFEETGERALMAGSDIVYFCSQIERVPDLVRYFERRADEDMAFSVRLERARERAEAYRARCNALRSRSREPERPFDEIRRNFIEFCKEFERACQPGESGEGRSQGPGTGKTGREEWT